MKCKQCKSYIGKNESFFKTPLFNFCSKDHAYEYGIEQANKLRKKAEKKAVKDDKKAHAARKRDFYANDTKTRKAAAKLACHKYIRFRDLGKPCICCDRPLGDKYDAGHWLESGNNPRIRYDEDNIHAQNVYCNQYQGGDSDDYEGNLRKKIGDERVERLKSMKGGTMKRTAQDYKEIEDYYNSKIKLLEEA